MKNDGAAQAAHVASGCGIGDAGMTSVPESGAGAGAWADGVAGAAGEARAGGRLSLSRLIPVAVLAVAVCGGLALIEGRGSSAPTPTPNPGASGSRPGSGGFVSADASASALDVQAEEFVRLALILAQHEPAEVDAYFGPETLRPAADAARLPLPELSRRAHHLADALAGGLKGENDVRRARLLAQARALMTVIDARATGARVSFDEEARAIYGMSLEDAPAPTTALAALDRALPGDGPLAARFAAYRARFAVPPDRRRALFAAALDGCRSRTLAHWTLPADERFEVKWQIGAPGAWHRYEGRRHSTLTLNPGAVEFIDTAVDLACHEGYPGHHAQFLLADGYVAGAAAASPGVVGLAGASTAMPIEDTIALLRSPVSMLREGAAQYAVDLAFPADERLRFERDVLFPIAGFAAADAARYFEIRQLVRTLEPAIVPILRDYRDGRLSAPAAAARLEARALVSSPQALLHFVDDLGPYVLGYTVARDRVATHITRASHATRTDPWTVLRALLAPPDITVLRVQPSDTSSTTN
jgi:hypothetical protein